MVLPKHRKQWIHTNFKSLPSTFIIENKEFQPAAPCQTCFSKSNVQAEVLEELGVRNLLELDFKNFKQKQLKKQLSNISRSVQVHWAQVEFINNLNCHIVFITTDQSMHSEKIIHSSLGLVQETKKLQTLAFNSTQNIASFFWSNPESDVLLIPGGGKHSSFFSGLLKELLENNLADKTRLVFISLAYECCPVDSNERHTPNLDVRINFSHPYFLSDLPSVIKEDDIASHCYHEIWKNTPVMMSHIINFLSRYRKFANETAFDEWKFEIKSIRGSLQRKFDIAGVGDLNELTQHSLKFLKPSVTSSYVPSIVLDSMKHQAIMVKSLFACMEESTCHSETLQIKKNSVLEMFRNIARLLCNELEFIYPPCIDAALIESKTLEHFVLTGIVSNSSDEVLTVEGRIAKNMARYLDIDSDEDEEFDLPPVEAMIYVNLMNLKANKWMVSIVDEMLEIYLLTSKMIHEIRQVDVVEVSCFLERIKDQYRALLAKEWNEHFDKIVGSALKMFEMEGIIERYFHSSDIGVVYCLLPFREERLLQLIFEISQII